MFYTTAKEFWNSYIRMINKGFSDVNMQNPAIEFVRKAKNGDFDHLNDEEYNEQLADTEDISAFWNEKAIDSASKILLRALNQTNLSEEQIDQLSEILSNASTTTNYQYMEQHKCNNSKKIYKDIWDTNTNPSRNMPDITFKTDEQYDMPYDIYNYLNHHIYGQESAKKAAAMLIYNHIRGNRRHIVMAGATGCGKTEIWRTLSQKYDFIQIINGPQISADGWYGSYHIRDIFWNIPQDLAQKLVIVIDEADKMLEPQIGGSGTDHSILIQNPLIISLT